jgi:hypothetical protein
MSPQTLNRGGVHDRKPDPLTLTAVSARSARAKACSRARARGGKCKFQQVTCWNGMQHVTHCFLLELDGSIADVTTMQVLEWHLRRARATAGSRVL